MFFFAINLCKFSFHNVFVNLWINNTIRICFEAIVVSIQSDRQNRKQKRNAIPYTIIRYNSVDDFAIIRLRFKYYLNINAFVIDWEQKIIKYKLKVLVDGGGRSVVVILFCLPETRFPFFLHWMTGGGSPLAAQ